MYQEFIRLKEPIRLDYVKLLNKSYNQNLS